MLLSALDRWTLDPGERITSVDVCGSSDGTTAGTYALTFGWTNLAGVTGQRIFGVTGGGVGGCSVGATGGTATGTTTGGQLLYLSGSNPGNAVSSLCFQWNVYP